jgi:hypothetical protein
MVLIFRRSSIGGKVMEPGGVKYGPHSSQQNATSKATITQEKRAILKTMKEKHQRFSSLPVDMTKVRKAEKPTWNDKHQGKVDTFLNLLRTATDLGAIVRGLYELRRGTKGVEPQTKVALQQGAQKFSPQEKRDAPQKVEWIKGQIKDGVQLEYLQAIKVGATTKEPAQKPLDPAPSQTKPIAPPPPFPPGQPSYYQGLDTSVATPYGAPLSHANTPAKPANKPQPMPASIAESEDLKSVIVVNKSESPEKLSWRQRIAAALWDYLDVLVTGNPGTAEFEELRTLLNESPLNEDEKKAEFHAGAHELHMNGLYLNKRLEIFVAGLLLKELRPEIEQDLAKTFVLATMSGTKKEIEDAAQRLDRYCFDSVIRDGENSTARVKWGIKEILERDLNQRSLDDTQKASLLKRLPSETKPFSIPILHDLLEKATPAKAAKQPQPTPAQIKSEDLESIIVVNKSEPRQPTLDHRGEAAVESFVDALIAGDDPKTLAFAFFGPKEPPDKTKLRHMMDEVYNQVKG